MTILFGAFSVIAIVLGAAAAVNVRRRSGYGFRSTLGTLFVVSCTMVAQVLWLVGGLTNPLLLIVTPLPLVVLLARIPSHA